MKTNTIQLVVGQLVRVKGKSGQFRYVGRNIVKDIASGKVLSVCKSKIKPCRQWNILSMFAKVIVAFIAAFLLTALCFDFFLNLTK